MDTEYILDKAVEITKEYSRADHGTPQPEVVLENVYKKLKEIWENDIKE